MFTQRNCLHDLGRMSDTPNINIFEISEKKKEWRNKNYKPLNDTTLLPSSVERERDNLVLV